MTVALPCYDGRPQQAVGVHGRRPSYAAADASRFAWSTCAHRQSPIQCRSTQSRGFGAPANSNAAPRPRWTPFFGVHGTFPL